MAGMPLKIITVIQNKHENYVEKKVTHFRKFLQYPLRFTNNYFPIAGLKAS